MDEEEETVFELLIKLDDDDDVDDDANELVPGGKRERDGDERFAFSMIEFKEASEGCLFKLLFLTAVVVVVVVVVVKKEAGRGGEDADEFSDSSDDMDPASGM
jgi:hypothetical protein